MAACRRLGLVVRRHCCCSRGLPVHRGGYASCDWPLFTTPLSRWQATGERLAERLRITLAFRIVESALVDVPSVIGTIRPVVLLPVAALTNLTPGQIEALLVHELAHIRRRDYAINIAQTVAEALLFFHPAVWWMSARIREEREHCCDDIAVEVCAEPVVYASALAELASWRTRELALSIGAADGALLARVRRILQTPEAHAPRAGSGSIALALGLLLTAGAAVQSSSQKPAASSQTSNERIVTVKTRNLVEEFALRTTDHFQLFYQRDLDLHADRVAREAEVAYERISGDLRHNLAKSGAALSRCADAARDSRGLPTRSTYRLRRWRSRD